MSFNFPTDQSTSNRPSVPYEDPEQGQSIMNPENSYKELVLSYPPRSCLGSPTRMHKQTGTKGWTDEGYAQQALQGVPVPSHVRAHTHTHLLQKPLHHIHTAGQCQGGGRGRPGAEWRDILRDSLTAVPTAITDPCILLGTFEKVHAHSRQELELDSLKTRRG